MIIVWAIVISQIINCWDYSRLKKY